MNRGVVALAALALLALAGPVQATTYYVGQDSAGTYSGNSCDNRKALSWFNANAVAGDVAQMCDGSYTTVPNPANSGTGWAPTARITYIGDVSDTNDVIVSGAIALNDSFVTIKGLRAGALSFEANAKGCSLAYISGTTFGTGAGNHRNVLSFCNLYMASYNGSMFDLGGGSDAGSRWDTLSNNVFRCDSAYSTTSNAIHVLYAHNNYITQNRFQVVTTNASGTPHINIIYVATNNLFYRNRWILQDNGAGGNKYAWNYRDSTAFNTVRRDTIELLAGSNEGPRFVLRTDGAYANTGCRNNNFDSCLFKNYDDGETIYLSGNTVGWHAGRFTHNSVISRNSPCWQSSTNNNDSSVVEHNTFVRLIGGPAVDCWYSNDMWYRWNIVYADSIASTCVGTANATVRIPASFSNLYVDRNLYYLRARSDGKSVPVAGEGAFDATCGNCNCSFPFNTSIDDSSQSSDPDLANITVDNFDPRPSGTSAALDTTKGGIGDWDDAGGYVGARSDSSEAIAAAVTLNDPDGGERWACSSAHNIDVTFSQNDGEAMAYAILEYNANGGSGSWTNIRTYVPDDDAFAYSWTTPSTPDNDYRVRVKIIMTDSSMVSDSSSANFTLLWSDTDRPNKVRNLWADYVGGTAVRLRWTSPAGDTARTTVCKYDTLPLTETGQYNFRTHGTSVSTGTPADAGVGDSLTITGLTAGKRYYFALRHIDTDDTATTTPETSYVSIGECRTTLPGTRKGLHARSTLSYPLYAARAQVFWESAVEDSYPRNYAGWPLYRTWTTGSAVSDSFKNALYAADAIATSYGVGTNKYIDSETFTPKNQTGAWGQVDSLYKSIRPDGLVHAVTAGNLFNIYKQHGGTEDTTGLSQVDPWRWSEFLNWFIRTQDTTGTGRKAYANGVVYPEKLFLWSRHQKNANCDTCSYGSWYGNPDSCYGVTGSGYPQRLNILYRDTTTGELAIADKMAQLQTQRFLYSTQYVSDPTKYQIDIWGDDFTGRTADTRLAGVGDRPDTSRSGGTAFVGADTAEFNSRWRGASSEFAARAYYWWHIYRPTGAWRMGNYPIGDAENAGEWGEIDTYENDWTGWKSTGGYKGIQAIFNNVSPYSSPSVDGSLTQRIVNLRSDLPVRILWGVNLADSCTVTDIRPTTLADRGRLALGAAAMFDNVYVMPRVTADNNLSASDPAANSPCWLYSDQAQWPFYWDETLVNVSTRAAVGTSALGTGTGRNWLGTPTGDKTWGWDRTASDTEQVSVMMGADTSCAASTGWSFSPSFGTMNAYGGIDTITDSRRGSPTKIFRVRRATMDHSNNWRITLRTTNGMRGTPYLRKSVRFWARADSVTYLQVGWRDSVSGSVSGDNGGACVWVDTTWREYEVQAGFKSTVPAKMDTIQPAFYFADTVGTIYLDDIRAFNRPVGFMYRTFTNGVVFLNPDSSSTKIYNVQAVFGDTASYDYGLINGLGDRRSLNNGRVFGYGTAAADTIPAGNAKFVIRQANGYWNVYGDPNAQRQNRGPRMQRVTRMPGR